MAILKTYPLKTTYFSNDRFIISDMQPDSNGIVHGNTKNITFSDLKSAIVGGSGVFGNGTAGRIPKWQDSNTLDDSEIFQSGTNIGIGTTNPTKKLELNGDFSARNIESIGNNTGVTFPTVLGWYRIMEWGGTSRGGTVIKLSTTGGNVAPTTYVINAFKTYGDPASTNTLKLEQYGNNAYLTKARIATDSVTNITYLEVYLNALGSGGAAVPMMVFHDSLLGYDNNTIVSSGTVTIAPATSVGQEELPFVQEGTTTEKSSSELVTLIGGGTNNGKLRFNCSANSHYVEIVGPNHSGGSSYSLELPNTLPSVSNQILESNALGVLSWIPTPSGGGGTPVGSTGSVQFKSSSSQFTGDNSFIFTTTNTTLTIGEASNDDAGTIEIQSDENGATLKIGGGSQTHYTSIKGSDLDTASYNIILPPAGPGGNNKILESTSAGVLSWIDTPGGASYSAGDGLDLTGTTFSTDLKANGGLVIEATELAVDLSASAITGTLAVGDGGTGVTSAGTYDVLVGRNSAWIPSSNFDGAIVLPGGTTAQRPSSSVAGMIRYNSSNALVEIYVDGLWKAIATV